MSSVRCTNCGCKLVQEVSIHDELCRDCDVGDGVFAQDEDPEADYEVLNLVPEATHPIRPYPTDPERVSYWMDLWASWGKR
jgi:hypothetical protein